MNNWIVIEGNFFNINNLTHVIPNWEEETISFNFIDGTLFKQEFGTDPWPFKIKMKIILEKMGFDGDHIKSLMWFYVERHEKLNKQSHEEEE